MSQTSVLHENYRFPGEVNFTGAVSFPVNTVGDTSVKANADISFEKVQHVHHAITAQEADVVASDSDRIVYIARAPGTVLAVDISLTTTAIGDSTVNVDVQTSTGGGAFASILTAAETLNSSTVVRTVVNATLSGTPTMAIDDLLVIIIDTTAGTGTLPKGICVDVTIAEEGQ